MYASTIVEGRGPPCLGQSGKASWKWCHLRGDLLGGAVREGFLEVAPSEGDLQEREVERGMSTTGRAAAGGAQEGDG